LGLSSFKLEHYQFAFWPLLWAVLAFVNMPHHPLFAPVPEPAASTATDQIQMALAIADAHILKSLLANCIPTIAEPHQVSHLSVRIGVPSYNAAMADGVLHYDQIQCELASPPVDLEAASPSAQSRPSQRDYSRYTRWQSPMHVLAQGLTRSQCQRLLGEAGFGPDQVVEILNLPPTARHRSWWVAADEHGQLNQPFLRTFCTRRYPNGTYLIQYQDSFSQDQPPCFYALPQSVLIAVRSERQNFSETLRQTNLHREFLGLDRTVLICNTLSELEAQGFINQGISVYPAVELTLPDRANCQICGKRDCPMNGRENSPVVLCRGFQPEHYLS